MKIRAITYGMPTPDRDDIAPWHKARVLLAAATARFQEGGVEVQTQRIALSPTPFRGADQKFAIVEHARWAERRCLEAGAGYISIGPVGYDTDLDVASAALAEAISTTELVFGSMRTTQNGKVMDAACGAAAAVVASLAKSTPGGFGNLRFAALASCPPGIPFFPAAYHGHPYPTMGLALEAADLLEAATKNGSPRGQLPGTLAGAVEAALLPVQRAALAIQEEHDVAYLGADLSPAPFPLPGVSIGAAMEQVSGAPFGAAGTLAACAMVTRALRLARVRTCGFSGFMLPVLEDSILAKRASEGRFNLSQLLLFSSVCGTGLDTVPIPGDTTVGQLVAVIRDMSALSASLRKPLTARLFPIPGKAAGEEVTYEFPYFAAGAAVLPVNA